MGLTHPHTSTSEIVIRQGVASPSCLVDCAFGGLIWYLTNLPHRYTRYLYV